MLASMTQAPELALSETEAHALAERVNEVQSHYDTILDPKTEAWIGLAITMGLIYVPRVAVLNRRMNNTARENTIDATAKPAQPAQDNAPKKPPSRDGRKGSDPVTPSDIYPPDQRGG